MKFTCDKNNIIEGINIVQRAVPTKTTTPILEGILLEVGEELTLTGNDNEFGIVYEVPAIIEAIGSIVLPSKTFGDIVRKLPDIYVSIETNEEDSTVSISSGSAHYKIKTFPAESYPPVVPIEVNNPVEISESVLQNMIKQTAFAASQDDKRMILRGVYIEYRDKTMNFVAVDGFRLAMKTLEREEAMDFGVIVPTKVLNEMMKVLQPNEENVRFCCNENQIMFFTDHFKMVSRLYKGDFVDYRKMLPREFKVTVVIDTKQFLAGIERAALVMQDEKKYHLVLKLLDSDEVKLSANAENGISNETISAEVSGGELELGFNPKNLMDCLRVINDEKISVSFTSDIGPCLIRGEEDESFTFLVMPVRTRG